MTERCVVWAEFVKFRQHLNFALELAVFSLVGQFSTSQSYKLIFNTLFCVTAR